MKNYNFSAEQQTVYDLAIDLARGEYSLKGDLTKADLEKHLRDTINKDILNGATMFQAWRRNSLAIFEIMERIVDVAIGQDVLNSPFIDSFVETRYNALGDKNEFYSEGGLYAVSTFAGNHWDTNRQSADVGQAFSLPMEWAYIHVYDELERFLLGIVPFEKMMDGVYRSINKFVKERLHAQFALVSNSVPVDFTKTGNSEDALGDLVDLVAAAGGYGTVRIAGTKSALRKLSKTVPENMFANSQKEAKANTGTIAHWEGNPLMEIPQALKSGTFEFALNNNEVYLLGGESKPVKLFVEGDSRTKEYKAQDSNDMTEGYQIQTKLGMGLLLPKYFGKFTFT